MREVSGKTTWTSCCTAAINTQVFTWVLNFWVQPARLYLSMFRLQQSKEFSLVIPYLNHKHNNQSVNCGPVYMTIKSNIWEWSDDFNNWIWHVYMRFIEEIKENPWFTFFSAFIRVLPEYVWYAVRPYFTAILVAFYPPLSPWSRFLFLFFVLHIPRCKKLK